MTETSEAKAATPESPGAGGRKVAIVTTADQILSSASNAILLFALAQVSSVEQFGIIALLVGLVSSFIGFNRGALGTPILLVADLRRKDILAESGYAFTWSGLTAVVAAVLLLVLGVAIDSSAVALAFAVAAPVILAQDVLRFAAISLGRPGIPLLADAVWAAAMTGLFALNLSDLAISPEWSVACWGASGFVVSVFMMVAMSFRPKWQQLPRWWATYSRSRTRFGVVQALNATSATAVTLAVAAIAGAAVAGGLRGASTLFGPIAMLVSALPMVFVPHARRSGQTTRSQWRLLIKAAFVTSGATILVTAAIMATPLQVGTILLGDTWQPAAAVAPFIGLNSAAGCWMISIYALFQAQGASRAAFHIRNLQLVLQLGASMAAAAFIGTAVAVALALAASCWMTVAIGVVIAQRLVTRVDAPPRQGKHRVRSSSKLARRS